MVGLRRHVRTPEERLRDMQFSIVFYVFSALFAIELVLRTHQRSLWGMSFALDVLFMVWIFWPLVKKLAITIGPGRA